MVKHNLETHDNFNFKNFKMLVRNVNYITKNAGRLLNVASFLTRTQLTKDDPVFIYIYLFIHLFIFKEIYYVLKINFKH